MSICGKDIYGLAIALAKTKFMVISKIYVGNIYLSIRGKKSIYRLDSHLHIVILEQGVLLIEWLKYLKAMIWKWIL